MSKQDTKGDATDTIITEQPWHAAFPPPKSEVETITAAETLTLLKCKSGGGPDADQRFVLVDLRRNDHEGGTITGSINLPAQSLYPTIPSLYDLLQAAGVRKVIWYCGSSRGRGSRAAAWFADHIQAQKDTRMESLALAGGIKGWVAAGDEYRHFVQGYDASKWQQQ